VGHANRAITTAIRDTFTGMVPEGFEVIEGDRRGDGRLNPSIGVAHVDWDALFVHPDAGIQRVAAERRKRENAG
jgi:hypothetical protein